MLVILEIANNHNGSVEKAKAIIDAHAKICNQYFFKVGFKIQLRDLDTLIHKDYQESDLKYVKRFRETALSKDDFREIVNYIKEKGFYAVATPFDENSVDFALELDVDIIKVASCSIDDWPLLQKIALANRMIIASTAGANKDIVVRAVRLFREKVRDVALMHCVGDYPTSPECSNLNRIDELRTMLGPERVSIGISTHESPYECSVVPFAIAKGCSIIEKHVDIEFEDGIKPNAYSCLPEHINQMMSDVFKTLKMLEGKSDKENIALDSLKRGVYAKHDLELNSILSEDDFYLAMPKLDGQLDASRLEEIIGQRNSSLIKCDQPIFCSLADSIRDEKKISKILASAMKLLDKANIAYSPADDVELSTHYGLNQFFEHGALIINKVNREYCKKLIVMFSKQTHPEHHHVKKEEVFELLYGDCVLNVGDQTYVLKRGFPILIPRAANHSFSTQNGCVLEEISTTHVPGDSVYRDMNIFKLKLNERKIKTKFPRTSR